MNDIEMELYRVELKGKFVSTGNVMHYVGVPSRDGFGGCVPQVEPVALSIVTYDNESYYIFYLDETGREQNDAFFETLTEAFEYAKFEFGVDRNDWSEVNRIFER